MFGLARRVASCHLRLRCLGQLPCQSTRCSLTWSPTLATCSASQLQVARPHLHLSLSLVFQSLRMAGTHREAPVLRQAPQKLGDVLYPPTEPHTTGMLEVSKVHTIYWEVSGNPTGTPVMVLHGGPGGGSQAEYRQYFDPAVYRVVQVTNWTMKKQTSCIVYFVNRWTNVVVAGPPPMLSWRTTTPRWGSSANNRVQEQHPGPGGRH